MYDVYLGELHVSISYQTKSYRAETTPCLTFENGQQAEKHFKSTRRGHRRGRRDRTLIFIEKKAYSQRASVSLSDELLAYLLTKALMDEENKISRESIVKLLSLLSQQLEKLEQVEENEP